MLTILHGQEITGPQTLDRVVQYRDALIMTLYSDQTQDTHSEAYVDSG